MLSRTGARACLAAGRRHIPASLRHSLAPARITTTEQQPCTATAVLTLQIDYGRRRHFASNTKNSTPTTQNKELATMLRAIEQENIIQTRKSFSLVRNSDRALLDRDAIRKVLMLVRKGEKYADLAFVREVVETMEDQFGLKPEHFEYHALIYAYGVHGRPGPTYRVLDMMRANNVKPTTHTYNTILGCYKRANDEVSALRIFRMMKKQNVKRDLVTYNTLIHFIEPAKALALYEEMVQQKVKPDGYTYSTILSIATREKNTEIGDSVYNEVLANPNDAVDTFTINSLLAYKANGQEDFKGALDLYYSLPQRFPDVKTDIVTYNIMLDACLKEDNPGRAFTIFDDLKAANCTPTVITYGTLIDAEARLNNMNGALRLFDDMTYRSIKPNERVLSSLANLAARESDPKLLTRVCDTVQRYSDEFRLDAMAYNGLLSGLARHGRSAQAQMLYDQVFRHDSRRADIATFTNLMLAYVNDNQLDDAMDIYYELREHYQNAEPGQAKVTLDTTFYTTLLSAMTALPGQEMHGLDAAPNYAYMVEDKQDIVDNLDGTSQPNLLRALTLFNDMRRLLIRPNAHVYTTMLYACAKYRDAFALEQIHRLIRMDLYFDPDTAVYNALMDAYNRVGDGQVVLQMWDVLMLSSAPKTAIDQVTISVVLDSCGHNGYSHKAYDVWRRAKRSGFELNTNNYNSYIECLCRQRGRTGWDEARRVISEEMRPPRLSSDPRPAVEEKTVNTLIAFARKKGFAPEEVDELEAWKTQLLLL
ncbi:hypothetical protein BDB00DRAFT_813386 [Zychaea mexicana]|uniref:uncharacterized protein n=1 Tax=Zychaea mexicana TaxID=64656 RepID=UPI0022FDCB09|nr:uncharacterized protein BDB00DRAFT_813386 [Zychaea mexicana]KAI9495449.1 hypothetical protein BDB00DRAFT_813386 [Zychaea mexicana]